MRVGLFQAPSPAGDIPAGLAAVDRALAAAARAETGMLVLPELFLPGYNAAGPSLTDIDPGIADRLSELVRGHGVALTIGIAERDGGHLYNSAVTFDERGRELARYRKVQLFGERERSIFRPGDRHVVFDYRDTRFGLLICYDVEFPEHVRALARAGAKVILVPTANMMPFVNVNHVLVPARAAENAVTIVYANYCGREGDLDYVGLSLICGPEGYPLAAKGRGPGLLLAELPTDEWREHEVPLSTQLSDLRRIEPPP